MTVGELIAKLAKTNYDNKVLVSILDSDYNCVDYSDVDFQDYEDGTVAVVIHSDRNSDMVVFRGEIESN